MSSTTNPETTQPGQSVTEPDFALSTEEMAALCREAFILGWARSGTAPWGPRFDDWFESMRRAQLGEPQDADR